jgi:hypothetical protein
MQIVEHRFTLAPGEDYVELYRGAASSIHVESWVCRGNELIITRETERGDWITEKFIPRVGMVYDCANGALSSNVVMATRRVAGVHLLTHYTLSLLVEDRQDQTRLIMPRWIGTQGQALGRSIVCAPGAATSLGGFVAWETGTPRIVILNSTGAFTVAAKVQLIANDAVIPYDASIKANMANLSGPGAWTRFEAVLGAGGTDAVSPSVISGREYLVYLTNGEAADQTISADVYIDPAGISR